MSISSLFGELCNSAKYFETHDVSMIVITGMQWICKPFSLQDEKMLFSKMFKSSCASDIQKNK